MKNQKDFQTEEIGQAKPKYTPPKMEKHPPVKVVQGTGGSSSLYTVVYYWY